MISGKNIGMWGGIAAGKDTTWEKWRASLSPGVLDKDRLTPSSDSKPSKKKSKGEERTFSRAHRGPEPKSPKISFLDASLTSPRLKERLERKKTPEKERSGTKNRMTAL